MGKILVTGASGHLGRKTLLHLLKRKPASQLAALVRDPAKAHDLAALGIEVRQGDYLDTESLSRAFSDIEKLMLTATHAFTDRNTAHANVIDEAVKANVRHLVFIPIISKNADFKMKEITNEDIFTVKKLKKSGLTYIPLRNIRHSSIPSASTSAPRPTKRAFAFQRAAESSQRQPVTTSQQRMRRSSARTVTKTRLTR